MKQIFFLAMAILLCCFSCSEETIDIPELAILPDYTVLNDSVTINFKILSEGESPITSKGFYGDNKRQPDNTSNKIDMGPGMETITNTFSIAEKNIYNFKPFASNSVGTCYAEVVTVAVLD